VYQQTIRRIEEKAAKIKRRNVAFAAFYCGLVIGAVCGLVMDFTIRLPEPSKWPGAFVFVVVVEPVGTAGLVGILFYALAIVGTAFCRAVHFLISWAISLCKPRAAITDNADG
jgi:F0F1-type ATP synthase membrane subunit c/vacuolar-type H+-ATPase subunit K